MNRQKGQVGVSLTFIHMQMKGLIFHALPETFSWSVTSTVCDRLKAV